MNNPKLVSVIIPTFNSAKYLSQSIDSALSQSYINSQIIVVDDGSTDDTADIIDRYKTDLIYIKQTNGGPASARNTGIRYAQGEYIAFLDADDLWLPDKIEKQVVFLDNNSEVSLVYTKMVDFDDLTGEDLSVFPSKVYSGNIFDKLLIANYIPLPSVLVRTAVLQSVGGFDETLLTAEDTNLWLKIARNYSIHGLDEILVKRRKHTKNISDQLDIPVGTLSNLDRIVDRYPELNPRTYPLMMKAYHIRGGALAHDYFYWRKYAECHHVCGKLLSLSISNATILFYWLLTLLPAKVINLIRDIKQFGYRRT